MTPEQGPAPDTAVTPSPALARVARGDLCAGCGGCAGLVPSRIEMVMEPPGWLRPRQTATLDPAQEAAIAATCPGLIVEQDRPGHPYWGAGDRMPHGTFDRPRPAPSGLVRRRNWPLLTHLLETGTVDRVVQVAASDTVPVANETVLSVTQEEVFAAAGSRYAPSAPLARLEDILEPPERPPSSASPATWRPCARSRSAIRAWTRKSPSCSRSSAPACPRRRAPRRWWRNSAWRRRISLPSATGATAGPATPPRRGRAAAPSACPTTTAGATS